MADGTLSKINLTRLPLEFVLDNNVLCYLYSTLRI